ncbi:PucR family transcriptional regulator [Cytobacillus praedii]|uniref:PucR family transcriptional regulator n=2 Tax=Cytobacillus praedii TaxID=1742358 RepID=A0A4R1AWP4_9BACI|nr:PucR family transcriptional regulator [Cytobacillus praedii]
MGGKDMPLTVRDILDFESLYESELIAGMKGLQKEVTGIMVMEAPDIEAWGNFGQVCLTSFFALENLSLTETKDFFIKANSIGIAAFIVKLDRLVKQIPAHFIEECNVNQIPLIKIQKDTPYEAIILSVMETLINKNKVLLDRYYMISNQFTNMALREPRLKDILALLEELIPNPVSLLKNNSIIYRSINLELGDFHVSKSTKLAKNRYINFEYQRQVVTHTDLSTQHLSQLSVEIPSLGTDVYRLIIHELNQETTEEDFMAIENTVSSLQMELLKKYALKQQNLSHLNEIINDLIYARYQTEEELAEILHFLNLSKKDNIHLVIIDLSVEGDRKKVKREDSESIVNTLSNYISIRWSKFVSLVKKDKIIFLICNSDDDQEFSEKISVAINSFTSLSYYSQLVFNIGISNKSNVTGLHLANKQANNILKILKLTGQKNKIMSYKDLGIFQLFLETNNIDELIKFVPEKILEIQKTKPELNKTLRVFLDHNQNFKTTAEELFIHPKTAKYRIERLIKLANINFENPEELLQINIGLRLLEFIDKTL